jgi:hypothetical protein
MRRKTPLSNKKGLATQFADHNLDRATLDRHLEVHVSDRHFSHELWLSRLRDHLTEERYAARSSRQCIAVARHFLRCLDTQKVDVSTAQPASVGEYLQRARRMYRRRHGHLPDYKGWQCLHTNGIHLLLRLVQGQWPPAPKAVTPVEILQSEMRGEYAQWMAGQRGLAPGTVSHRCCEAGRLLDWLGERATREELATLTHVDVDGYRFVPYSAVGSVCALRIGTGASRPHPSGRAPTPDSCRPARAEYAVFRRHLRRALAPRLRYRDWPRTRIYRPGSCCLPHRLTASASGIRITRLNG